MDIRFFLELYSKFINFPKGACMLHEKAKRWLRGDEGLGFEIPAASFVWWL
jgi:hypothetical protein